ncbi:hypothetical protein LTR97_006605 [Elasticomyces elasticus]|uniref:Enoyl reductase (ER) domain-containing protein n=1 Tax=Elasticomyces elasticus TaxID=574655 RepID=A0AAN7VS22_9PEZI|nr:hypothetical protein LTR97_006605 [Elasticomyces elasticus]
MKALRMTKDGLSAPILSIEDIPTPSPGPGEMLIKIHASSVQPADILNSKGGFGITTFPRTPGKDFAGTVETGPSSWKGKKVFGTSGSSFSFTKDGAQAEYTVVPIEAVAEMPKNLSFPQAASLGTPWTTADLALIRAQAKEGETVMVLGATGSVGSAAMEIAKLKGCKTISVGRHGTDVDSTSDSELKGAKELTGGKGPDVVFDTVGDFKLTKAAFDVLAFNGRLVTITSPRQGSTELSVDILSLYRRQISLVGCNTAAHPQEEMGQMLRELAPAFESGKLTPPEEKGMTLITLDQAPDAYSGKLKKAVIVFDK